MKIVFGFAIMVLMFSFSTFGQEKMGAAEPTNRDKTESIPINRYMKRGSPIGSAEKVALSQVFVDPAKFSGKLVLVEGVIVRSCKMEGCWAELAAKKDGKSVRVKMKDHAFFIPLQSAGAFARAEGVFAVKVLSKEEVEHMIKDDGAKFPDRNADGSVTEVSFEATGIELKRATR